MSKGHHQTRSRNPNYDNSSEAEANSFGAVVWGKCNSCGYRFKDLPGGTMDMIDFREHKASHGLPDIKKKKYSHRA